MLDTNHYTCVDCGNRCHEGNIHFCTHAVELNKLYLEIAHIELLLAGLLPLAKQAQQSNEDIERFGVLPPGPAEALSEACNRDYELIQQAEVWLKTRKETT